MTIEEKVFAVLAGAGGVVSLVPSERIMPDGVYLGLARPYIKHFAVGLDRMRLHDRPATLCNWPYQVSIFGESVESITAVRTAVIEALEASVNPHFSFTGLVRLQTSESTDVPILGQALLLDAWFDGLDPESPVQD